MNLISIFRRQHHQIEEIAAEISMRLSEDELLRDESDIRGLISGLLTKLTIHQSLETDALLTGLRQHHDHRIVSAADRRAEEAAQLFERIHRHRQRWSRVERVGSLAALYVAETRRLLQEMLQVLQEENDTFDFLEKGGAH